MVLRCNAVATSLKLGWAEVRLEASSTQIASSADSLTHTDVLVGSFLGITWAMRSHPEAAGVASYKKRETTGPHFYKRNRSVTVAAP